MKGRSGYAAALLLFALALAVSAGCGRKAKPEPLRGADRPGGSELITVSR